jgi:hypothetical protein
MPDELHNESPVPRSARPIDWRRDILLAPLLLVAVYLCVSYLALPAAWRSYVHHHPALEHLQRRTATAQGIPADPLNIAFIGTQEELLRSIVAAGWIPADPITWGTSARIAVDSVTHRAYPSAPVSDLFVWGRKQDMAFEQPFGPDPRKRHHVRFWRSAELDEDGRPLWLGAATFDTRVGVSHLTGQVTHHIDAEIDHERDKLADDFATQASLASDWIDGFQEQTHGRNGGGDPYVTDGRLLVVHVASTEDPLDQASHLIESVLGLLSGSK